MDLKNLLQQACESYSKKGAFGKEDRSYRAFTAELPDTIRDVLSENKYDVEEWGVQGSAGKGNWTDNPWVAVFHRDITDRASNGYYVVFLVSKDCRKVVLALANSITDAAINISEDEIKKSGVPRGWVVGKPELGTLNAANGSNGREYEKATVLHKVYQVADISKAAIDADLIELLKIYERTVMAKSKGIGTKVKSPEAEYAPSGLSIPKNLILVGPPGVGKTFKIQELQKYFESGPVSSGSEALAAWIEDLRWWEVIAIAMREIGKPVSVPELCEHEYMKTKIAQTGATKPRQMVWGNLQTHTIPDSRIVQVKTRAAPFIFDKDEESRWFLAGNYDDVVEEVAHKRPTEVGSGLKRYEFVTFHQAYSYEDFIEGIRPEIEESESLRYELHKGVFKRICERAKTDPQNEYAIFIDEINRANISRVFGELITLIEEDKRLGKPNALKATLPYSKEEFGVPSNLYVIGTMNSADRSVALLDVALRRRFRFQTLYPNLGLIPEDVGEIKLRDLIGRINQRISYLLSTEYQLGHAYFMAERVTSVGSLRDIWYEQVLPLLKEYFFDDTRKLRAVCQPFLEQISIGGLDDGDEIEHSFMRFKEASSDEEFVALMEELSHHLST